MTTSSTVILELTGLELITKAFQKLGIRAAETPLEDFETQDGVDDLNLMLKSWQQQGLHLWLEEEGILFLDVGKESYLLGPTGDEATTIDDFIATATTAAYVANDTVLAVSDTTGMVAGDNVGVRLDDGTRFWTTLFSVNTAQVTLAAGLTSASASGSTIFTYTTIIQRPLRISSSRRKTHGSDNEIEVYSWSRNEYFNQVNKAGTGTVVNAYYSPLLGNGKYYVWQTASSANDYVRFTFERPIEIVTDVAQTLDIPSEWFETIIYNLAARLTDSYTVPAQKKQSIFSLASVLLEASVGWDQEMESLNVSPDFS